MRAADVGQRPLKGANPPGLDTAPADGFYFHVVTIVRRSSYFFAVCFVTV